MIHPPFDDPLILVNMSVWESPEPLREFVYKSGHLAPLRDRAQWFEKPSEAHLAMWWTPAGHIPSVAEARERLEFRRRHGDTAIAFSFRKQFSPPDEPDATGEPLSLSFNNRIFISAANTSNGDCTGETKFEYRQRDDRVWATYRGGRVNFGSLVAIGDSHGRLDMRYQHVDESGRIRTGKCTATPETLSDGRLRLLEQWQWTNGDYSAGQSIVEEVRL